MAIFRCEECDKWLDNDRHPCEQHPIYSNELICPECLIEMEDTPQVRQKGQFTKGQLATIKQMELQAELDEAEEAREYEIEQRITAWSLEQEKKRG